MFLNGLYGFPSAVAQAVSTAFDKAFNAVSNTIAITLSDTAGYQASVFPIGITGGALRTVGQPVSMFYDAFDNGLDTAVKWHTGVTAGGGVAASNSVGFCAVGTGTTANGYAYLQSVPVFEPESPGWLQQTFVQNFEYPVSLNGYRAWGGFIPRPVPTATNPISEGYGWELSTAGKLYAVCYAGSTRNQIADLSVATGTGKQPADSAPHNYIIYFRPDRILWFIDDITTPVAQTFNGALGPNTNSQSLMLIAIAGSTPPASSLLNTTNAVYMADTTGSGVNLTDGAYSWVTASIKATLPSVPGDTALVVAQHPSSPLPAGTNALGAVSIGGSAAQAAAGFAATVSPAGALQVSAGEGSGLFNDVFDGLDTINRWTTSGTVTATIVGSNANLASNASLSASCGLTSQPSFLAAGLSSLTCGWTAKFETISNAAGTLCYLNSHRFMGIGTVPATWVSAYTASATTGPMLNAVGYEIDTDGKLYPVIYSNGVRTRPPLSFGGTDIATGNGSGTGATFGGLLAIANGIPQEMAVIVRPDVIYWYLGQFNFPIASLNFSQTNFVVPAVLTLPLHFHTINGASSTPSGTMVYQIGAVGVSDTGGQSTQLSDGQFPWRKATVNAAGALRVQQPRDTGRVNLVYSVTTFASGLTGAEKSITLNCSADLGTRTAAASFIITAGKTFRITAIIVGSLGNVTTPTNQSTIFALRVASGTVSTGSQIVLTARSATYASAQQYDRMVLPTPEGLEFAGNGTVQFGITANSVFVTNAPTWDVTIIGYEY